MDPRRRLRLQALVLLLRAMLEALRLAAVVCPPSSMARCIATAAAGCEAVVSERAAVLAAIGWLMWTWLSGRTLRRWVARGRQAGMMSAPLCESALRISLTEMFVP